MIFQTAAQVLSVITTGFLVIAVCAGLVCLNNLIKGK